MLEFYLLITFLRFPLRKSEFKFWFSKESNARLFRTRPHSSDEGMYVFEKDFLQAFFCYSLRRHFDYRIITTIFESTAYANECCFECWVFCLTTVQHISQPERNFVYCIRLSTISLYDQLARRKLLISRKITSDAVTLPQNL